MRSDTWIVLDGPKKRMLRAEAVWDWEPSASPDGTHAIVAKVMPDWRVIVLAAGLSDGESEELATALRR